MYVSQLLPHNKPQFKIPNVRYFKIIINKALRRRGWQDEMVELHHRLNGLNGHEFEQALVVDGGQGSLACCSPWGRKELDPTEWLNWTHKCSKIVFFILHHAFPYVNRKNYLIKGMGEDTCTFYKPHSAEPWTSNDLSHQSQMASFSFGLYDK